MSDDSLTGADVAPKERLKVSTMAPSVEAQLLIPEIAGPMRAGSQIQEMLNVVARKTGIGFRRVKALWHGEARRIDSNEMDALRSAAAEMKRTSREAQDRAEYQDIKNELAAMQTRMADFAAQLARATADGAGPAPAREGSTHRPVA